MYQLYLLILIKKIQYNKKEIELIIMLSINNKNTYNQKAVEVQ